MLQINSKGFLVPDTCIKSTVNELGFNFANDEADPIRKVLFDNYIIYSNELKEALGGGQIVQWIDGSYVTKKKNPGDIDLVTFVDADLADAMGIDIDQFKYPMSVLRYGVDAYLVKVYGQNDKKYPLFIGDKIYWMDNFDKSRRDNYGKRWPKGFLEIIY